MALNTMIQKLVDARKAYDAQLAELNKAGAEAVAAHLAPKIPTGYYLTWTQGTPSFNDGDPCTFSVHDPYLVPLKPTAPSATACTCGHPVEEHGGDGEHPNSTMCQTCVDDTDGAGECDTFEADVLEENEIDESADPEGRLDTLCISKSTLQNYGVYFNKHDVRHDGTPYYYHQDAEPELPGFPRAAALELLTAWDELPKDLLKQAFGDDVRPRVNADGTHSIDEWDYGY